MCNAELSPQELVVYAIFVIRNGRAQASLLVTLNELQCSKLGSIQMASCHEVLDSFHPSRVLCVNYTTCLCDRHDELRQ